MKRLIPFAIAVTLSSLLLPNSKSRAETNTFSISALKTYPISGVFVRFDTTSRQATITHDAIPGYMEAMTMDFDVDDTRSIQRLHLGDKLKGRLCVSGNRAWIDHIIQTGTSLVTAPVKTVSSVELSIGDRLPDVALVDQAGAKFKLSHFQGRALAITFIYTRCPLPTYCPLLSRNFQTAQVLLYRISPQEGGRFLSISMDPTHDSPETMATYAKGYQADPAQWIFATGPVADVSTLGNGVGLEFRVEAGRVDHNLRTVVVDKSGRVRHIFRGNQWTPQELVSQMLLAGR